MGVLSFSFSWTSTSYPRRKHILHFKLRLPSLLLYSSAQPFFSFHNRWANHINVAMDLVSFCHRFNYKRCTADDFSNSMSFMGLCHTFNTERHQNVPGSGNGLSMLIYSPMQNLTEQPLVGLLDYGLRVQGSWNRRKHGVPWNYLILNLTVFYRCNLDLM